MKRESWKLLVVDDDSVLGEAFQTYYSDDKYHVQVAGTVKEGLELIRNNLDLHTIFCDFHLPDEQGTLVLDTLSSLKITIPVIMMSNAAERSDLISFINKNAFYFVEKSHGFAEFDKALRRALKDRVKKLVYESRLKKTY